VDRILHNREKDPTDPFLDPAKRTSVSAGSQKLQESEIRKLENPEEKPEIDSEFETTTTGFKVSGLGFNVEGL
jgi:hypothetical protein